MRLRNTNKLHNSINRAENAAGFRQDLHRIKGRRSGLNGIVSYQPISQWYPIFVARRCCSAPHFAESHFGGQTTQVMLFAQTLPPKVGSILQTLQEGSGFQLFALKS